MFCITPTFALCSLFYIVLLAFAYFFKKRIKSQETKIYSFLILTSILGVALDNLSVLLIYMNVDYNSLFYLLITKLIFVYFITWLSIFFAYVLTVSRKEGEKVNYKKFVIIYLILAIVQALLPIDFIKSGTEMYPTGLAVGYLYIYSTLLIFIMIIILLKNLNHIDKKKIIPLFAFFVLGLGAILVQFYKPSCILMTSVQTFVTFLMYFTIENPDVKMIEKLEYAKNVAEKANSVKNDFLANMSHEIRTPLNAVMGFSECIETAETLDEAKENARDIVRASATLLEIVNGILDISKIEAGKIEIISAPYQPKEVFEELAKLITPRMKEKCLDFRYNFDDNLPKVLIGDSANLRKIITNFLSNACKYTPAGYVKYDVKCQIIGDTARLVISVEDSGQGVKKENIDKLFAKFQRLESDKNAAIEGTGLGLNITKQLADMMGANIDVQSEFGQGSTFTLTIDQKIGEDNLLEESKEDVENLDLTDVKILMVDDNELNIKVGLKVFKNYNANCIDTAKDGYECLEKVKNNNNYDIILLDDQMPGMNGGQTLEALKNIPGFNIPVIALTANALTGMREKYIEQGFNDYLAKPLEKIQIVKVLNKIKEDFNIRTNNGKEEENKMNEEYNQNMQGTPVVSPVQPQVTVVGPEMVQQATQQVAPQPVPVQPQVAPVTPQPVPVQPQVVPVAPQPMVQPVAAAPVEAVTPVVQPAPVAPTPAVVPTPIGPEQVSQVVSQTPAVNTVMPQAPVAQQPMAQTVAPVEAVTPVAAAPAPVESAPTGDPKDFLVSNGCDVDKALELLGDMEMYNETVCDFLEEVDEKWQRIQNYQLVGDMPNYAIEVHSLKSDARYLGFYVLGDIAFDHEIQSKENNVQYVNEHYPELVAEYNKTLDIIKRYKEMI